MANIESRTCTQCGTSILSDEVICKVCSGNEDSELESSHPHQLIDDTLSVQAENHLGVSQQLNDLYLQFTTKAKEVIGWFLSFVGGFSLMVIIVLAIFSIPTLIGAFTNNVHILSIAGLFWMILWINIFFTTATANDRINQLKAFFHQLLQNGDISTTATYGVKIIERILGFVSLWTFTFAGVAISFARVATSFHIALARGEVNKFFTTLTDSDFSFSTLLWFIIVVGAPLVGFIEDIKSNIRKGKQRKSSLVMLGIVEFYRNGLILITGLFGGGVALNAVHSVFEKPFSWFINDWFLLEYAQSISYQILHNTNLYFFIILYIWFPIGCISKSRSEIKSIKQGKANEYGTSFWRSIILFSYFILLIAVLVTWHEGWLELIFTKAYKLLKDTIHFLYQLLVKLFS